MASGSVALGRPWHPFADAAANSAVAFVDCWMDDHIETRGWDRMSSVDSTGTRHPRTAPEPAILLWTHGAPGALGDSDVDKPTITPYSARSGAANGTGVVIFPGGGYEHLALDHEGAQVAAWLNELGITAFVVSYRLGPRYHHPAMLQDARRAVRLVRANAKRWELNPERVGVMGFSAGGHMAATVATHFDAGIPTDGDPIERASSRPDFVALLYPVITMSHPFAHQGSRDNLLGADPSPNLVRLLSDETQVTPRTPPTFIVATTDDATVPVENSEMFYDALRTAKVPAEIHLFESGHHGFGLAPGDPALSVWRSLFETWMRRHAMLPR